MVNMTCSKPQGTSSEGANVAQETAWALGHLSQKSIINKDMQEIQNLMEACAYLDQSLLTVPLGQDPTPGLLMMALQHILEYKSIPKQALNAIRAVAFLLEELEENALHQTIWDSVTVQLNELASDLKEYVTDATQHIDSHLETKMAEMSEAIYKNPCGCGKDICWHLSTL